MSALYHMKTPDSPQGNETKLRTAILQRVIPSYRIPVFRELARHEGAQVRLFIGDDVPNSKVRSGPDLDGLDIVRLNTRFFAIGDFPLTWHSGLLTSLRSFSPHIIVCEGDSNMLSYFQALWYQLWNPDVAVIHWSLGGLPGQTQSLLRCILKKRIYSLFDAFIVYSSFGKRALERMDCPTNAIFVAVNVADTHTKVVMPRDRNVIRDLRAKLGLSDQFTVAYVGALDVCKRLDVLIEALACDSLSDCNFLVIGDGQERVKLENMANDRGLRFARFYGQVNGNSLSSLFRTADVLVLPGRGGMVISEAMAYGIPVIVYQADGTEYDLVIDGETGLRLSKGDVVDFREALLSLLRDPNKCEIMGRNARKLVANSFTLEAMVREIRAAICWSIGKTARRGDRT